MQTEKHLSDITILARSRLLRGLGTTDIGALLEILDVSTEPEGAQITRAGSSGNAMFIVLGGELREDLRGEVRLLRESDQFGELALLAPLPQPSTVTALTPVRLAILERSSFDALSDRNAKAALHISKALLAHIADELTRSAPVQRTSSGCEALTTRVLDVLPKFVNGAIVVAGVLDHLAVPLTTVITGGAKVEPLSTQHWEGREIFRRGAGLALLEAARRVGFDALKLGPSITSGRIVFTGRPADDAAVAALNAALRQLIAEDLPIVEETWKTEAAIEHFNKHSWTEAVALLEFWHEPNVNVLRLSDMVALSPGPTVPSTGMLDGIDVYAHPGGLLLDFGEHIRRELPQRKYVTHILELTSPRYGADMTLLGQEWLSSLFGTSVGGFNQLCVSGRVQELINVSEGFHEKRIALIADEIKARKSVKLIAISGPSSAGKTTFIKRLKVQLQVNGIRPHELSLDDYYVDRAATPRDPSGEYDYEALSALNLHLLNEHIDALLSGESVVTAKYDFITGKSLRAGGPTLTLGTNDVLLVEGIHALNPELFERMPEVFRIFVHPATSLSFDRLSAFEPADIRLVRRIVRDRHRRAITARENLSRWPSVRRAERLHVFAYQANADAVFDSSLVYEPSVLRVYADRYLLEVGRSHPEFSAAYRLRRLLSSFVPIHPDHVPPTSILREFIGGSGFNY